MQHTFGEFSEKHRRVELESDGNCVAKIVLVESANQFSLEELQFEIFFETISTIRPCNFYIFWIFLSYPSYKFFKIDSILI